MSKLYFLDENADFNPEAPTVADLENATDLTPYVITRQQIEDAYLRGRRPYFRSNALGQCAYTPADELRDRLNEGLQGKPPALPVNTRYWRS